MKQVMAHIEPRLAILAKQNDLSDLKHEVLTANASLKVFAYKLEQSNQLAHVNQVDRQLEQQTNETQRLINQFTPEVASNGQLKSKDILRIFDSVNKSIVELRRQMTRIE
jgi:phenylalanyl-tRNA synthetase alpha subunit